MNRRSFWLSLLLAFCVFGCASAPEVAYPDTPDRISLMNRILEKTDMPLAMRDEKEKPATDHAALAETKTQKAKEASKKPLPDEYWKQYKANELKYVSGISNTDALALQDYKNLVRRSLAKATDAELKIFDAAPTLSDNADFRRVVKDYNMMAVMFFSYKNSHTKNVLKTYIDEMNALDKKFGNSK